ncbi:hypothetical protein [Actinoalloteichus sp. GBA129-24]|uniref:hypothetical protein n=1 Tax=Actinoalloteichus sp. GBA129-24 TaxID=1612551 RepID=UPI0009504591|nr:hypothetical protein [Actinoalloteichus sp. GBA129-24]APU22422.1 hypothetical protein UA75_22180 [Actinoalloteichus sp. GBA129-24]
MLAGTAGLVATALFRSGADALLVGALAVLPAPLAADPGHVLFAEEPGGALISSASFLVAFGACLVFGAALRSAWSPILDDASWRGAILPVIALAATTLGGTSSWVPAETPLVSLGVAASALGCAAWARHSTRRSAAGATTEAPAAVSTGAETSTDQAASTGIDAPDTTATADAEAEPRPERLGRAEPARSPRPGARFAVWSPLLALVSIGTLTAPPSPPAWGYLLVAAGAATAAAVWRPGSGLRTGFLAAALLMMIGSAGLLHAGRASAETGWALPDDWPLVLAGMTLLALAAPVVARAEARRRVRPVDGTPVVFCLGVAAAAIVAAISAAAQAQNVEAMPGVELSRAYATPLDTVFPGDHELVATISGPPPTVSIGLLLLGGAAVIALSWPRRRA